MELEKLIVPIGADISGLLKGIDKAKSGAGDLVNGLAGIGGGVVAGAIGLAGAGIAGLTGLIGISTKAAMDAESIQADLNATLKSTGGVSGMTADSVNGLAKSLSEVTKFEDDTIVSGENMLLTFTNIGKDVFPTATEAMLNMSQKMGTDLKGSAIQLGKALNNPIDGISALTRVGVTFTEEQKKQIKAMQDSGDMAGAQKVILAELEKEFGGVAKAAGETSAGKLEIFKNKIGNIQEDIGNKVLPVLAQLSTTAGEMLNKPEVQAGITAFVNGVGDIASKVIENIPYVITNFQNLVGWFQTNQPIVVGILSALGVAATAWGITTAIAFVTASAPMLPVIAVLALVGVAAGLLYKGWTENFMGMRDKGTEFWNNLQPIFNQVKTWLSINIPLAIQTATDIWNNVLVPAFKTGADWFTANLLPVIVKLGELIGTILVKDFEMISTVWNTILKPALEALWGFIDRNLLPIFQKVGEFIGNYINSGLANFASFLDTVTDKVSWLSDGLRNLIELLGRVASAKIPNAPSLPTNKRAMGGTTSGLTWVGERGPELVDFPSGTNVFSNAQSNKMAGNDNQDLINAINSNRIDYAKLARVLRDTLMTTGG